MRLIEAILEANHRAPAGRSEIVLPGGPPANALPLVALTCIDPRLNTLLPGRLGIPEEQFIWLRNAGNIITGALSSTMRSLALACAIKGAREIAIIGHTDCLVCKTTMLTLTEALRTLGVDRHRLPDNLVEYFGLFASERQNVQRGAEIVRSSPLIGPGVPVHGLLLAVDTGRLEWVTNGYDAPNALVPSAPPSAAQRAEPVAQDGLTGLTELEPSGWTIPELKMGSIELPAIKIGKFELPKIQVGNTTLDPNRWLKQVQTPQTSETAGAGAQPVQDPSSLEARFDKTRRYKVIGSDQKVYGPIDGLKLLQWIAEGRIGWDTASQVEGHHEWRPLSLWVEAVKKSLPPRFPASKQHGSQGREP